MHIAYAKILFMNEGENSGASVTPETRDTSEKVFSVRNNNPTDETFSVVENSAAPNIQNGKKENSIADQMAAELALAEADEGGVLNVHEAPKFTSDNDEKIETITASSQDYADAFSIIGSNDKNKSVTVGSATAISAGKGKGKTGFFGRSRYNSEEAEEAYEEWIEDENAYFFCMELRTHFKNYVPFYLKEWASKFYYKTVE